MTTIETTPAAVTDPALAPRVYVHEACGTTTPMPEEMVRGYLADPHRYNSWAFCRTCDGYVHRRECRWTETGENLDDYFRRLRAAAPPPPESKAVYAAPVLLAAVGWLLGAFVLDAGRTSWLWMIAGFALGLLLLVLRRFGLR
jgi:hypothetical protein